MNASKFCEYALELGFVETGFCSTEGFFEQQQYVQSQIPLRERNQLRYFPRIDEPKAKSLAVLLWPYLPSPLPEGDQVFIDNYYEASNAAYHAAQRLEERLIKDGCYAKANVSYPAKAAAMRSGLGIIGKNSLLITKNYGTRVVIILMATDIMPETEANPDKQDRSCLNCGRCRIACPVGAIDENGMSHPERCLRNYMMEGVVVPESLRGKMSKNLLGCDVCQRVCPMQPKQQEKSLPCFCLKDFMQTEQNVFSMNAVRLAEIVGKNTARPQRIRAQAALLAGNSGNLAYLPVLQEWAELPFEAVSEHAKWAMKRIEETQKTILGT